MSDFTSYSKKELNIIIISTELMKVIKRELGEMPKDKEIELKRKIQRELNVHL